MTTIESLKSAVAAFRDERDWAQFHTPKNLAIAISVEASELLELFLWRDESDRLPPEPLSAAEQEMADVFIYLVSLADALDVDLGEAVKRKLQLNAEKYPKETSRGSTKK